MNKKLVLATLLLTAVTAAGLILPAMSSSIQQAATGFVYLEVEMGLPVKNVKVGSEIQIPIPPQINRDTKWRVSPTTQTLKRCAGASGVAQSLATTLRAIPKAAAYVQYGYKGDYAWAYSHIKVHKTTTFPVAIYRPGCELYVWSNAPGGVAECSFMIDLNNDGDGDDPGEVDETHTWVGPGVEFYPGQWYYATATGSVPVHVYLRCFVYVPNGGCAKARCEYYSNQYIDP